MSTLPQLRYTSLQLGNWRNFRHVDIKLASRAFFLGPNASGKSNLLDSLRFLAEIAQPGRGGLQAAVDRRGGFAKLRCLNARNPSDIDIKVSVGNDAALAVWTYTLKMNVKARRPPRVLLERIERDGALVAESVNAQKSEDLAYSQTLLEQVSSNVGFRELATFIASSRYLHVVPQIVRDRSRAKAEGDDPYGGDLLRRIKAMPKKSRTPRLRRLSDALAKAVPQFRSIDLDDDEDGVPHLKASFSNWRKNDSTQSEVDFSDGTLRLIGLLWSIAERGGPLLLEEPELSLNDDVVAQLPRMFETMQKLSGRQVITTTHSSSLIDATGVGLRELHRLIVDGNGSRVLTAIDDAKVAAQVNAGMSPSEALMPLLRPPGIEGLGKLELAG